MKSLSAGSVLPLVALLGVALGTPARADVIASNVVTVATANGSITVASTVEDEFLGDASRWLFQYQLSGDYDPSAPDTNGISSLQIFFDGSVLITDQTGPAGWEQNETSAAPPFGAGWDLPDSVGYGVGPSSGDVFFYFAVPARTAFTIDTQDSSAGSHFFDVPFGLVSLVDDTSGEGPIVPVPEPASLLLQLGAGLGLAARLRLATREVGR